MPFVLKLKLSQNIICNYLENRFQGKINLYDFSISSKFNLDYIILTGGSTFSTITAKSGESSTISTPRVEVADTVGAGDSFSGTFTARILTGSSLKQAHRDAVNTAAYVCTQEGAWPQYPEGGVPDYVAQINGE